MSAFDARFVSSVGDVGRAAWKALRLDDHPFTSFEMLDSLEASGSLSERLGWRAHHLELSLDGNTVGVAPCYLKANSHGEFVFDHAWAEAFHRYGRHYYPKLLCAVPYTPVSGRRVLAGRSDPSRCDLAACAALESECARLGLSGAHINFLPDGQRVPEHWIVRHDIQFHWRRDDWESFEEFLAALTAKKRKNIRQERARVARQGIGIRRVSGADLTDHDMRVMYGFYLQTFDRKGNYPALTESFFLRLRESMADQLLLTFAEHQGETVAGACFLFDSSTLYGRYWGCSEDLPGLHFELCYYQGIEFCLERGIGRFEPGAQGEHKVARGFMPVRTRSAHYIADPAFREAIADAMRRERSWIEAYQQDVLAHAPYRDTPCTE